MLCAYFHNSDRKFMNQSSSSNVHDLTLNDKRIILVGTAHISQASVEEVRAVIEQERPDAVCVELCASRLESMRNPDAWKKMDIFQVIKEGKTFLLLANLLMSSFQKRIGQQLGVQPGAEMMEGVRQAEALGATLVLADRDVRTTLQRTWRSLTFWTRIKLLGQLLGSLFSTEEISKEEIEAMKQGDALAEAMDSMARQSPQVKQVIIDERDQYLSEKIRTAPGNTVVAVVGAGHVAGILQELEREHDLQELNAIPHSSNWIARTLGWGIPLLIIGLIGYGFFSSGEEVSLEMMQQWFLINGSLSALGVLLAFGHPVTVLTAFVAAPFTSLNPMVAAGWVAGLVEAFLHKPQVRDFENLNEDILEVRGFWRNKITRILLVVMLANVGSSIGTLLGGFAVASLL
ncbi:MAG: TraB/GumN family protein [bacterium]